MRALRILAKVLGGLLALVVTLVAALFVFLQTPSGQRTLAGLVSGKSLQILGISGTFPTDLQVARVELLDQQGAWLRVDNAGLRWSFASLLNGRVQVEIISASLVDVLRPPIPDKAEQATTGGSFSLPLGVEVQSLSVDALHLAAAVAQVDSRWALQGNGLLSADLHEGRVRLTGDRSDGPSGKLSADMRFDLARGTVDGEIALEEGAGGVAAALLERSDLDRIALRLVAKGDARSGNGELTLSAGDAATAKGTAKWQPSGTGTVVSVQLEAGGAQLAARVGGPVTLSAEATLDADSAILTASSLTAGPATLGASGRYDRRADRLDAMVTLQAGEPGPFGPLVAGARWRDLRLDAHAVLDNVAKQPQGSVTLNGSGEDVVVPALDGRLPPLGHVALDGRLGVRSDGSLTLDSLDVTSALGSVKGNGGSYLPKTGAGDVKATVDLPSLAPFSALAERELTGRAHLELSARNDAQGLTIGWQGTLADVGAPGVPPGLVAREVTLSGSGALRRDDTWALADVRVTGEAGTFGFSGNGHGSTGRFDLSVDLRQLSVLREGLAGAITASSTIELRPDGTAGGSLTASGTAESQPLSLAGRFERDASGGIAVPSFEFHWASAVLGVTDLAVTPNRTTGSARLKVEKLQDVGALVGTALAGSLEAEVSTDPQRAAGRLQARVRGSNLQSGVVGAAALQVDATIDDPMGTAKTDATIAASSLRGAADIARVNATVKGDRQSGFDIALQAAGAQSAANLAAKVELVADEIRIALSRFDGRHQGIPVALNAPMRLSIAGARVRIDPTSLRLGGGRLSIQGVIDPAASDLALDLTALPLSLIDTFAPGTGLDGSLQARARITGPTASPRIEATYAASNVRLRRPEAALLPALGLQGSGSLVAGQTSFDARLSAGTGSNPGSNLALRGRLAIAPLAGSVTLTGPITIAPFAPLLGNEVRNVTGTLNNNLTVNIAGSKITGAGSVDFSNGALDFPEMGLRLNGGTGRLVLQGDSLQVQQLSFQTGRGGTLSLNGNVRLDPADGVALDLAIASRRSLLVNRADLVATVSSDLKVTGSTAAGINVSGPITIDRAEIAIGAMQTASFPTVEVREINRPGVPNAPPAGASAPRASTATPVRLKLDVRAPQAVFVRGRGLDAEVGGSLQVTGDPSKPLVLGGFTLRRGDFTLGGRRLVFSRGVITLDNLDRIDPMLDFVAGTTVQSTAISIAITGTARAPAIAVSSSPPLPSDEALAWLLFGKPASALSALELLQVAQTLAELTGREAPGTSLLGRLRSTLGLDQLKVGSGASSSSSSNSSSPVSLEAGRYVSPGVYVGAKQGAAGNSSRGVVEIDVLDHTKVEGDIGADSNGRVGVKMEWDY
jgi:translocation and assembly module TamB